MLDTGTSTRDALDGAVTALAAAGCETPKLDAELLLAHVLGVSRARLITGTAGSAVPGGSVPAAGFAPGAAGPADARELTVAGPAVRAFQDAVKRRSREREPVAYITGVRAFRRLELAVDPRALIPRPETELLVEVALTRLHTRARVLDLGTGSGAVALALADERQDLRVSASDVDPDALSLARANARRLKLEDVDWLEADLLEGIPDEHDAIVANLPYVAEPERAALPPEIVRHEPALALFAGPDGLARIRALLTQAAHRSQLRLIALEVGAGQASTVAELMRGAGFAAVSHERDLAGIERVVVGEREGLDHLARAATGDDGRRRR